MSENKKDSSSDGSFERLAIPPNAHEMMLTDIKRKALRSPAVFPKVSFPVDGVICGENNRLMVCLPCRSVKKSAATINVWFIVDTGSNCTFLAKETIQALICTDDPFPHALRVAMQDPDSKIECHLLPPDGHFVDANVLGMLALRTMELSIDVDWKHNDFKLIKK